MSIENPELYNQHNYVTQKAVLETLEETAKNFKWVDNATIMDIGAGDGGVTAKIFKKYVPDNFVKLLGSDISHSMVKFANEHYSDERTVFTVLDITGELPEGMRGNFNHVFSFFVFHRIFNQEKAFENVYNLLTEGGNCFLVFIGRFKVYDAIRKLALEDKWKSRTPDVKTYCAPYHYSQDLGYEIHIMMEKIGFKNIDVKLKQWSYDFNDLETCKNMIKSVNICSFSSEDLDEHMEDLMPVALDMGAVEVIEDNNTTVFRLTYDLFVIHGGK